MQSFLTNMICCLVIRLTFILFLALITAPIPATAAAVLLQPGGTPGPWYCLTPFYASLMLANTKKEKKKNQMNIFA